MGRPSRLLLRWACSVGERIGFWLVLAAATAPGSILAQPRDYAYVAYGSFHEFGPSTGAVAVADTTVMPAGRPNVVATIPLGFNSPYVTAHPNGRFVFASGVDEIGDATDIAVIDTSTDRVLGSIAGAFGTWNSGQVVVFQPPELRFAWAKGRPDIDSSVIAVIDTQDPTFPVQRIPLGDHVPLDLTFTPDGQAAIVREGSGFDIFIRWIDTASLETQDRPLNVGSGITSRPAISGNKIWVPTQFPPVINVIPATLPLGIERTIGFEAFQAAPATVAFDPTGQFAEVAGYLVAGPPFGTDFIWKVSAESGEIVGAIDRSQDPSFSVSICCRYGANGTAYTLYSDAIAEDLSVAGLIQIDTQTQTVASSVQRASFYSIFTSDFALTSDENHALAGGGMLGPSFPLVESGFLWMVSLNGSAMQLEAELAFDDDVTSIAMSTHEPRPQLLLAEAVGSVAYVASGISMSAIQNRPGFHRDVIPYQGGFGGAVTFALTPTFFRAYAANGNSVVPINLLTRDILSADIIPLAGHPQGIAATQDGTSVFVASLSNDISEINTTTNTVARQIDVNRHVTYDIAITDVGGLRGYAAGGSEVLVLDLGNNPQVVATIAIPPPAQARYVAISPDGKRAYVTGGQSVARPLVIDSDPSSGTLNTIIGALEGPTAPTAIAISPNGALVYVLNLNNQIVSKVGTRSGVIEGQIDLGGVGTLAGIALTTDGSNAFVSNNVGTAYAIRTSSMTLIDDPNNPIPVDSAAWGVAAR